MGKTKNFYEEKSSFDDFNGVTDADNFDPVPDDWTILVTDVKNSTQAIEQGRYRDVNKIGAGSLAVIRREFDDLEVPFVFDGDGAIMVVPPEIVESAKNQLAGLRKLTADKFDLDLRVASIPVTEVNEENLRLEVGKFELAAGRSISVFRGGGLKWAEQEIKRNREQYSIEAKSVEPIELDGLSCRWQPIPSERGNILSIIIEVEDDDPDQVYKKILEAIDRIVEGGLNSANPINTSVMRYKSLTQCLQDEVRYHSSIYNPSFLFRFLEILLAITVFRIGWNPTSINDEAYLESLETHSDYRKFYDNLRLIVDCTEDEMNEIDSFLEELQASGSITYGMHRSDNSLMTCYVDNLNDGGHIHFIDGGAGGYTLASSQLEKKSGKST